MVNLNKHFGIKKDKKSKKYVTSKCKECGKLFPHPEYSGEYKLCLKCKMNEGK